MGSLPVGANLMLLLSAVARLPKRSAAADNSTGLRGQPERACGRRPRPPLNLRAATALADMVGGARGSDGADRRRTLKEVPMKTSKTAGKAKPAGSGKHSRPAANKSAKPQQSKR